mmetsp:Transcript_48166/g.139560  ORF Transcript_48166/g.139560 Transcript_48166/m.139560 type:complete len:84 (+) Transcript_48166:1313-1564(+)
MVGTIQCSVLFNAALAQRHIPVRTPILENSPLALAIHPSNKVLPEQLEFGWTALIEILNNSHRIPRLLPAERLTPFFPLLITF